MRERMHDDDLRAIIAASTAMSIGRITNKDIARGLGIADAIMAAVAADPVQALAPGPLGKKDAGLHIPVPNLPWYDDGPCARIVELMAKQTMAADERAIVEAVEKRERERIINVLAAGVSTATMKAKDGSILSEMNYDTHTFSISEEFLRQALESPKANTVAPLIDLNIGFPTPKAFSRVPDDERGLTPLEQKVQVLMEPDKNGNVGRPTHKILLGNTFTRVEDRTLQALWEFARITDGKVEYHRSHNFHKDWQRACAKITEAQKANDNLLDRISMAQAEVDKLKAIIEKQDARIVAEQERCVYAIAGRVFISSGAPATIGDIRALVTDMAVPT